MSPMARTRSGLSGPQSFRGCAGAEVLFVDELVDLVETDRQSPHSNMFLTVGGSVAPVVLDAFDDLQIKCAFW